MRTLFLLLLIPSLSLAADRVPPFGLELSAADKSAITFNVEDQKSLENAFNGLL